MIVTHHSKDRQQLADLFRKYGDYMIAAEDREALDLFLAGLKQEATFDLVCLDADIPSAGGIAVLKAIRQLEEQYDVQSMRQAQVVMITAKSDIESVRRAFEHGSQAFAVKPLDERKLDELLVKLKLLEASREVVHRAQGSGQEAYFKGVKPLAGRGLEVVMETGTTIHFGFESRLNTARFGSLQDDTLFDSVRTDGHALIFEVPGKTAIRITASEFMDLVLIDRRTKK